MQAEYDVWCEKNARVFHSVAADASELSECKSTLLLASGGNPLLLDRFRRRFESTVLRAALRTCFFYLMYRHLNHNPVLDPRMRHIAAFISDLLFSFSRMLPSARASIRGPSTTAATYMRAWRISS